MSTGIGELQGTADGGPGGVAPGVIGMQSLVPASGLVVSYEAGIARLASLLNATTLSAVQSIDEFIVQPATYTVANTKDTYVYVYNLSGVLTIGQAAVANGGVKPRNNTLPVGAELIAKVVASGGNVTGITDMRRDPSRGEVEAIAIPISFEAGEVGTYAVKVPFPSRILYAEVTLYKAAAGTDAGTIQIKTGIQEVYSTPSNALLTVPLSSIVGFRTSASPGTQVAGSATNFAASVTQALVLRDQMLQVVTAKTTAGGKGVLTVYLEMTPK